MYVCKICGQDSKCLQEFIEHSFSSHSDNAKSGGNQDEKKIEKQDENQDGNQDENLENNQDDNQDGIGGILFLRRQDFGHFCTPLPPCR